MFADLQVMLDRAFVLSYPDDNFYWHSHRVPKYELSSRPEAQRSGRDLLLSHTSSNANGSVGLPFVIPSHARALQF